MSSSTLTSQVVVFATAMAAFSGTVLLFAIKTHKSSPSSSSQFQSSPVLRPCLSSGERKGDKKKKRVRFAEDVVDPTGDNEEFRRQKSSHRNEPPQSKQSITASSNFNRGENRGMPANRAALYNGILRDRVIHQRFACSY